MANFDEKTALEIQSKFNLQNSVINKWRFRNSIPSKYLDEKTTSEKKAESIMAKKLSQVLQADFLNKAVICKICGVFPKQIYLADFKPDKIIALKKQINELKINIAKTFEKRSDKMLFQLVNDERIFLKNIMNGVDQVHYTRLIAFKEKRLAGDLPYETWQIAKECFIKSAIQMNL